MDRNAKVSPLLRLSAELRIRIWEYALTHEYITLRLKSRGPRQGKAAGGARYTAIDGRAEVASSAPYLPETCRQVYIDTATLAYSLNIFYLGVLHDMNVSLKHLSQFPALKHAIRAIEVGQAISVWYNVRKAPFLKPHFPQLKQLSIRTSDASRSLGMGHGRAEEFNVFIGKIRELEGQEFHIVLVNMDRKELV
jgi:hypothetical protein